VNDGCGPNRGVIPSSDKIGPGRLVLVVGPSGAGKDTLIEGARAASVGKPSSVFPRRVVTRPSSPAEDHDTCDVASFHRTAEAGLFALWWQAHGNWYGIPRSIDDEIRSGRTVVCNVSRTVVELARSRYDRVLVVAVTAPRDVLRSRLAARERRDDGSISQRIERSMQLDRVTKPDVTIENIASPASGIHRLLQLMLGEPLSAHD
jgi:ribose 1,5-bisphosphokinase